MKPDETKRSQFTGPLLWFWMSASLLAACVAPRPTALNPVEAQLSSGAPIYTRDCATEQCHGLMGDGLREGDSYRVWPLVGLVFEARNPNAQVIFDVVRSGGEANLRALSDHQIYDAIAYELAANGISLSAPLTAENAADIASGQSSPTAKWGELYPPPGNAILLPPPPAPDSLTRSTNGYLDLRVDQLALARRIGDSNSPDGGAFAILVIAFQNLSPHEITLEPAYLSLIDDHGQAHALEPVRLAYPMENFHRQNIPPEHGTAALAIFSLPDGMGVAKLVYDDQSRQPIAIDLQK